MIAWEAGLPALFDFAMKNHGTWTYHLHGFRDNIGEIERRYLCLTGLVARVAECLLSELLRDDRLLIHAARLEKQCHEELDCLRGLSPYFWQRLCEVIGGPDD